MGKIAENRRYNFQVIYLKSRSTTEQAKGKFRNPITLRCSVFRQSHFDKHSFLRFPERLNLERLPAQDRELNRLLSG